MPQIDRDERGAAAARQRVGQALGARQPVRPDRSARGRPSASARGCGRCSAPPDAQRAIVHIDMESYEAKDLTLHIFQTVLMEDEFRDWPTWASSSNAICAIPADDLAALARLGASPRHAGLGAAGQRGLLGLRDGSCPVERLADAGVPAQMGNRRELRAADAVPAAEPRAAAAGAGQPQRPLAGARHRRCPTPRPAAERLTKCKCSTAWPTRKSRPSSSSGIGCGSTCPTAS